MNLVESEMFFFMMDSSCGRYYLCFDRPISTECKTKQAGLNNRAGNRQLPALLSISIFMQP